MTTEEALKEIKERVHIAEYVNSSYADCVNIEALNIAISAMEKQIPKKPIRAGRYEPIICPCCGEELSVHHGDGYYTCSEPDYCYNNECHQALDWT